MEGCDKVNINFTPFGKAKIKRDRAGAHGPRTQPGAGTGLGKDRWSLYSIERVVESSRRRGFCSEGHPPGFYLEAREYVVE